MKVSKTANLRAARVVAERVRRLEAEVLAGRRRRRDLVRLCASHVITLAEANGARDDEEIEKDLRALRTTVEAALVECDVLNAFKAAVALIGG